MRYHKKSTLGLKSCIKLIEEQKQICIVLGFKFICASRRRNNLPISFTLVQINGHFDIALYWITLFVSPHRLSKSQRKLVGTHLNRWRHNLSCTKQIKYIK